MLKNFKNKKFSFNLSWLLADKILRASINFVITILLARNLGPESFGNLSYLLALIFLFITFSSLGINPVLTNKIIRNGIKTNYQLLLNSYTIRFFFSFISYLIFLILIILTETNNFYYFSVILGLIIILKSSEVLFSYFEAKSLSKFIVISQFVGLIMMAIFIIFVFAYDLNIIFIYFALLLESIIIFLLINYFFFKVIKIKKFKFNYSKIKIILNKSFPVLITSLSIIVYMRIDQIMIKSILNEYSVGLYSASVRLIESFHFLPKILMISFLPILLKSKHYKKKLINLNGTMLKLSFISIIILLFFADKMIHILYGSIYLDSYKTTIILSFSILFVFYGVVNEHWYINKNLQIHYAKNVLLGAFLNILLNFILIRKFGISGAAYATLITYFSIIFIFDILNYKTREILNIKLNSFLIK